jgi:hypothetical protein
MAHQYPLSKKEQLPSTTLKTGCLTQALPRKIKRFKTLMQEKIVMNTRRAF